MKTLVILSDTHRNLQPLDKIATVLAESDYIIHLGDLASDANGLLREYPQKTYVVAGNNDFFGGIPGELVLQAEGRRLFMCHGHHYGVKSGTERLVQAAKERGCDIALYGHTHVADVHEEDGVLVIMDLGSAVMTTEMVVELFEGQKVEMVDCPLVEGAVVATIDAVGGMSFEAIKQDLAKVGATPKF